jgi:hypothetical protein
MKTKRSALRFLILASSVLLLVFAGCQSPFEQPDFKPIPRVSVGKGYFKFDLGEITLGRTILPATPNKSDFQLFMLEFFSNGERDKAEWVTASSSTPITLDVGVYELHVTAYLGTGKEKPAAWGSKTNIVINEGETTSASVELAAITNAGQGTFEWTINFPPSTSTASMEITPLASGTKQTRTLTNGVTDSLDLNAGYYRVVFTLRDNAANTGAERWEILHIYQNLKSAFACSFTANQFQSYTGIWVTTGTGTSSTSGSLPWAINNVLSGGTIIVDSSVKTIQLTSQLQIAGTKNFVLEGNGVKILAPTMTSPSFPVLYIISGAVVTIRRVHFDNIQVIVIWNKGNVSFESCVFSNNKSTIETIILNEGTMSIKGSTFYKNSGSYGGAISMDAGTVTLTGNLFYGNTSDDNFPIVYPYYGPATSGGYNVVDIPLGTNDGQSGWTGKTGDKVVSNLLIAPASFKLLSGSGAHNVIASRPNGYPTVDFYGNPIPQNNAAAGAVQATASGYYVEVSVNDSNLGSAAITMAPEPNSDGLYSGGSVTFTATSTGLAGYGFQYWQVNNDQQLTSNLLTLPLTDHYTVKAVFGRISASASVTRVLFSGTETIKTVTLTGLSNKDIYLVKVNASGLVVSAENTGGPPGSTASIANGNVMQAPDNEPKVRMGHPAADEFNANHPPLEIRKTQSKNGPLGATYPTTVGATTQLWVEATYGKGDWVQKTATLKAMGKWGNIWVMNDLPTFTTQQAEGMSDKFDSIYPIETSLLGDNFGGWNIGSKIQILVYDIGYKYGETTTLGYFWGKDMYTNNASNPRSNEAAMFYINGNADAQTSFGADQFYSTLVHEFQHMIHFSQKKGSSYSWYNEMLSMLAEDLISPLIGIGPTNSGHPIPSRIPTFLSYYNFAGIAEWGPNGISKLYSYAIDYAFGAYLLRNYGGAELLHEMFTNDSTNKDSITAALRKVNGNSGLSFEEALRRFGEAMIFTPTASSELQSFNKTNISTVNGQTYTATGFNVWNDFFNKLKVFDSNEQVELRPYSLTVHQGSAANWKNKSGNVDITLQRPNDPSVEYYLMVK